MSNWLLATFNFQRETTGAVLALSLWAALSPATSAAVPFLERAVEPRTDRLEIAADREGGNLSAAAFQAGMELYHQGTATAWQEAISKWEKSLEMARQEGDTTQEALTLKWLGLTQFKLHNFKAAQDYYQQALESDRALGDRHSQASVLNSLGQIQTKWGEYQKAFDYYEESLKLWKEVQYSTGEAASLHNISRVYSELGNYDQALAYSQEVLELVRDLGNPVNTAAVLNNIGHLYTDLKEQDKALAAYNEALALLQDKKNAARETASTLNNLGFIYAQRGNWQQAQDYYNRALPLWREIGHRSGEASTLNNLGFAEANLGKGDRALDYYNQALALREATGDRAKEALTRYRIAAVQRDRGNPDAAIEQIRAAISIVEDLRTNIANTDLRASFFASKQDYYDFYIDLLMQRHKQNPKAGYDRLALQTSESARARTLLEVLKEANADIRRGVDPQLLEREKRLQRQLSAMEERRVRLLSRQYTLEEIRTLEQEIETLLNQYRQVRAKIRDTSPQYAALTQPQPLTLEQIQQQILDEKTVLLEYSLGEERSYLWAVTNNTLTSYELPGRKEIQTAVRDFRRLLLSPSQRRRKQKVAQAQMELSNLLLKPAASQLGDKRLLVVGDGALQYVPFAALSLSDEIAPGERPIPLIVEREIVTLPSASTLAVLRREQQGRTPASQTIAVFADPVFGADDDRLSKSAIVELSLPLELQESARASGVNLARLPFTQEEANKILELTESDRTIQAFGFDAKREAIAQTPELNDYRILHFATHGLANSQNPELSGLVFSLVNPQGKPQNGFLRMHELFNLELSADLVVLSACQTGLGTQVRGEGLIGLTRGFMYAGASRVVASLWNVDDQGTAELMAKFYRHLFPQKGEEAMSPAAAMRASQIEMWQEKKWESPYYWAGFTLQGEW